jgi:hypothetical protein
MLWKSVEYVLTPDRVGGVYNEVGVDAMRTFSPIFSSAVLGCGGKVFLG